jgi:hypothetical protein
MLCIFTGNSGAAVAFADRPCMFYAAIGAACSNGKHAGEGFAFGLCDGYAVELAGDGFNQSIKLRNPGCRISTY